ncbi:MAG: hypothetical protein COY68_00990 [Candidatus Levybacteria bacterium CG_4_10_14_0_8_um_filter_35_23]|nr:MAG: hypothetical protein COY68_00990 [Candidatus Levybacteria bacterium CG_4_10_14_0_8_um_filter_35_23]PJC54841.1 MAG: hypothetical protein CO028_00095 [Candidatus Levybacteria bacterium CG_4_9_14_0_2_um_filter_35_21]
MVFEKNQKFLKFSQKTMKIWKVKIGTLSAVPVVTDGHGGSIWGYIKTCNNKLRLIIFQKDIPVELFGSKPRTESKTLFIRHKIFISDIVPLSQIIPKK